MAKKNRETKNDTVATKILRVIAVVLGIFVALVALVFLGAQLYFGVPVIDFYKSSEKAFVIPGLRDNMVPQGLDYIESKDMYLIGGYQNNSTPSRIYRVERSSGKDLGYVSLADSEGNGVMPHAGGLAVHGDYVFVAGDADACLYVYSLDDVLNSNSGALVNMVDKVPAKFFAEELNVAFVCFSDEGLIIGEFYREPNYPTPESHTVVCPTGEENHAIAVCYHFSDDETSICGISTKPSEAYSLPGLVQGMAVYEGKMWISQSYATAKSTICCYDVFGTEPVSKFFNPYSGIAKEAEVLPVYALDSDTLVSTFEAPPMAEEIIIIDGKMYIMCESASNKYIFGNLTGGRWCYATDISIAG